MHHGKHYKIMHKPTDLSGNRFLLCDKWAAMSELLCMLVHSLPVVAAHLQQIVWKTGNACQLPAIKSEQHMRTTFGAMEELELLSDASGPRLLLPSRHGACWCCERSSARPVQQTRHL